MNLREYLRSVEPVLDSKPEFRLAVSLDNLRGSKDRHLIGLDLVEGYARATDPEDLDGEHAGVVGLFRRALQILACEVPVIEGRTYADIETAIYDLDGSILDLADESEARTAVARIGAEPVLARLIADRIRYPYLDVGESVLMTRKTLVDHGPAINAALDSHPEGRLAVALARLRVSDGPLDVPRLLYFVQESGPMPLSAQLLADTGAIRRAIDIIAGRTTLAGRTYWELSCAVGTAGGSLYDFVTEDPASEILGRIAAAPVYTRWLARTTKGKNA